MSEPRRDGAALFWPTLSCNIINGHLMDCDGLVAGLTLAWVRPLLDLLYSLMDSRCPGFGQCWTHAGLTVGHPTLLLGLCVPFHLLATRPDLRQKPSAKPRASARSRCSESGNALAHKTQHGCPRSSACFPKWHGRRYHAVRKGCPRPAESRHALGGANL